MSKLRDVKAELANMKKEMEAKEAELRKEMSAPSMKVIYETMLENGVRDVPMFGDVETAFHNVINNRPKLAKEEVIWNSDHTESATGFLWLDKNQKIEVAQHWQII